MEGCMGVSKQSADIGDEDKIFIGTLQSVNSIFICLLLPQSSATVPGLPSRIFAPKQLGQDGGVSQGQ